MNECVLLLVCSYLTANGLTLLYYARPGDLCLRKRRKI